MFTLQDGSQSSGGWGKTGSCRKSPGEETGNESSDVQKSKWSESSESISVGVPSKTDGLARSKKSSKDTLVTQRVAGLQEYMKVLICSFSARLEVMKRIKGREKNPFGLQDPFYRPISAYRFIKPYEFKLSVHRQLLSERAVSLPQVAVDYLEARKLIEEVS